MEIAASQNQPNNQDVSLNQPNSQADSSESESKSLSLKFTGSIKQYSLEIFLIATFSVVILTALNYFNIIPISSVFPVLSFLPQQNQTQNNTIVASQDDLSFFNSNFRNLATCDNSNIDKHLILNQIIKCTNPQEFTNTTNKTIYSFIPNTDQLSIGDKGVQINFSIKADTNGRDDLGLMFGGDTTDNRLYLAYYPNQNSWGTQFLFGSTVTSFVPIYHPATTSTSQRAFFSLKVSADEKTLTLLFPNGDIETFNEGKSFYTKNGDLPITAVLPPGSAITIYNLNSFTPQ